MSLTMYVVRTRTRLGPDGQPYELHISSHSPEQARKRAAFTWGDVDPDECIAVKLIDHLNGKAHG